MNKIDSQAFFLHKKGTAEEAFELRDFQINAPVNQEVLIEVESFGLNYADVMARRGLYKEAPAFPCVVGYEVVGKIIQLGTEADQSLLGKRVMAFCRFGGYSKHVITNDFATVVVSDQPASELLALCTQAVTAYYMAIYLTPVHKGDKVLIHAAAGGVGSLLIQMSKSRGAIVIAKVGRKEKEEFVRNLGADYVVNYNDGDYKDKTLELLQGERIDVSFNPVAGSTYKKDFELMGSGGRLILFGASEISSGKWGIFSKLNFVRKMGLILPVGLMMRSKNVLGVNMLKIADNRPNVLTFCLSESFKMYKDEIIKPQVGGAYEKDEFHKAHNALESGKTTGKLSVNW